MLRDDSSIWTGRHAADRIVGRVPHAPVMAGLGRPAVRFAHLVHDHLPSALGYLRVGGRQVSPGNLEIEDGLAKCLILGMEERASFSFVFCSQARLPPRGVVLY